MFADESAFYLLPCVVRTWAKVGQTPRLRPTGKREHLSVASAVSLDGRLVTLARATAFDGAGIVSFLKQVLRRVAGKVILIWDRATIHRCREVKAFLGAGASRRLRLIGLPAYAPELNPDEGIWRWLKRQLGNVCCQDTRELRYELGLALQRLRRRPEVLRACFDKAGLPV
jgi:transposase